VPHEVIVNTGAHEDVGLIVVGSHGRTGITKLLMGSVTERVIGLARNAVLVWKL
jgi:nucleotide-binding universal stress UspA family protein